MNSSSSKAHLVWGAFFLFVLSGCTTKEQSAPVTPTLPHEVKPSQKLKTERLSRSTLTPEVVVAASRIKALSFLFAGGLPLGPVEESCGFDLFELVKQAALYSSGQMAPDQTAILIEFSAPAEKLHACFAKFPEDSPVRIVPTVKENYVAYIVTKFPETAQEVSQTIIGTWPNERTLLLMSTADAVAEHAAQLGSDPFHILFAHLPHVLRTEHDLRLWVSLETEFAKQSFADLFPRMPKHASITGRVTRQRFAIGEIHFQFSDEGAAKSSLESLEDKANPIWGALGIHDAQQKANTLVAKIRFPLMGIATILQSVQ